MVPYAKHLLEGTTVDNAVNLHKTYGEVVRISPVEVSFISGDTAFQDIYGMLAMEEDTALVAYNQIRFPHGQAEGSPEYGKGECIVLTACAGTDGRS